MATVATAVGIAGVVGVVDVILRTFKQVYRVVGAEGELIIRITSVLDICEEVKSILKERPAAVPASSIASLKSTLDIVCRIAVKYESHVSRFAKVKLMPNALGRLRKLDAVKGQMELVLKIVSVHLGKTTASDVDELQNELLRHNACLTQLSQDLESDFALIHEGMGAMQSQLKEILDQTAATKDAVVESQSMRERIEKLLEATAVPSEGAPSREPVAANSVLVDESVGYGNHLTQKDGNVAGAASTHPRNQVKITKSTFFDNQMHQE